MSKNSLAPQVSARSSKTHGTPFEEIPVIGKVVVTYICKSIGCLNDAEGNKDFCAPCINVELEGFTRQPDADVPDGYVSVGDLTELDAYGVHHLFQIPDSSGCLQQASRQLLMSGTSSHLYRDIREARNLLTRWLELNKELNT